MNRVAPILLLLPGAIARAADGAAGSAGGGGRAAGPPVPLSADWVPSLLLVLLWLLLAAAVLGPIVRYFKGEPRAAQTFSDDPPARPS